MKELGQSVNTSAKIRKYILHLFSLPLHFVLNFYIQRIIFLCKLVLLRIDFDPFTVTRSWK